MRRLIIEPNGWPCTLLECPPGHFLWTNTGGSFAVRESTLCFKTEYQSEVFNSAGEYFHGTGKQGDRVEDAIVQPVIARWEDVEV